MRIEFEEGALPIRGVSQQEGIDYSIVELSGEAVSSSSSVVADATIVTSHFVGENNYQIVAQPGFNCSDLRFESLTPDVCTVSEDGIVERVSTGFGTVEVSSSAGALRSTRYHKVLADYTTQEISSFTPGSLARHIYDSVASMVAGRSPSSSTMRLFLRNNYTHNRLDSNGYNYGPNDALWNPDNFVIASGYDTSGLTTATFYGAGFFPAKLITPRHVICADHVSSIGFVVFRGTDGNYYTANADTSAAVVKADGSIGDVRVWHLDAAMPAVVKPFKVLPANYSDYFTYASRNGAPNGFIPFIGKSRTALDGMRIQPGSFVHKGETQALWPTWAVPPSSTYIASCGTNDRAHPSFNAGWWNATINGDSSGPLFCTINGELILLASYWYPGGGAPYGDCVAEINAALAATAAAAGDGGSYSLTHPDLSGFPTYS